MRPRIHSGIKMRSYTFEPTGEKLEYAILVPRKASRSNQPSPLIIALHGLNMPPVTIANDLATLAEREGYIVAAPTGYRLDGWYGHVLPGMSESKRREVEFSEQDVLNVLEIVRRDHSIDDKRIHLVGMSMGGTGVLHLARKYPGRWAAVAALAPGVPDAGRGFESVRGTPLMIMLGDRDQLIPIDQARSWVARMRESGVAIEYFELQGGNHGSPHFHIAEVFKFLKKYRPAP
jgi:poly(3-hydroxybutyrate) depolymerase